MLYRFHKNDPQDTVDAANVRRIEAQHGTYREYWIDNTPGGREIWAERHNGLCDYFQGSRLIKSRVLVGSQKGG
jgi:hypothetical protein